MLMMKMFRFKQVSDSLWCNTTYVYFRANFSLSPKNCFRGLVSRKSNILILARLTSIEQCRTHNKLGPDCLSPKIPRVINITFLLIILLHNLDKRYENLKISL